MRNLILCLAVACGAGLLSSCTHTPTAPLNYAPGTDQKAYAVIRPVDGQEGPRGEAWLMHEKRFLRLAIRLEGLQPGSTHGVQIDTLGGCAGRGPEQVYNPQGHFHAGPAALIRQVGNLGNLEADADGKAVFQISLDNATLNGKEHAIMGRSITINANTDDLKSDPHGGLGQVVACGVIGVAPFVPEPEKQWYTAVQEKREDLIPESLLWYVPEGSAAAKNADGK